MRTLPAIGRPSPRHGRLGLWTLSLGPNSPVPGERLQLALIDGSGAIVRRFEQVEGRCVDPGYGDFFGGPNCRPARHEMPLVDIAPDGTRTTLIAHYSPAMGLGPYLAALDAWVTRHGSPAWALGGC